ncbi:hypothetical protein GE09DRAFT_1280215 [Coniochaeta sp. 2T2.1]|nr:hypothetical protein GE09DRAFT_1280215 [Coniochaeta sp. 2T2.1]
MLSSTEVHLSQTQTPPPHTKTGSSQPDNPAILRLPREIIIHILSSLPSIKHLPSVLLSHRAFNTAFRQHKQCVFLGILLQQIPRRLLPLAVATHKVKSLIHQPWDSDHDDANWAAVGPLLEQAFVQVPPTSPFTSISPLTPLDVLSLEKTQSIIHHFTTDFASTSLPLYKASFSSTPISRRPDTPTADELDRIYRAFYRFELYTRTLGLRSLYISTTSESDASTQSRTDDTATDADAILELGRISDSFFNPWSAWANEQLLCVYKYLDGKVAAPFSEIPQHDLEWAYRRVNWVEPGPRGENRRYFLHFGLSFLCKLLHAPDYASRKRIIDTTNFPYVGGRVDEIRLPDLIAASSSHLPPDIPLTPDLFGPYHYARPP